MPSDLASELRIEAKSSLSANMLMEADTDVV
jgi:hypothetical protein